VHTSHYRYSITHYALGLYKFTTCLLNRFSFNGPVAPSSAQCYFILCALLLKLKAYKVSVIRTLAIALLTGIAVVH